MSERKTKVCRKCSKRKKIKEFYEHARMADGHLNHCRSCHNEAVKRRQKQPSYKKYRDKWRTKNKERLNAYSRAWNKDNATRARVVARASYLYRKYGLTNEQHALLLEKQNGKCAICERKAALGVDHCHRTGRVRGLLCGSCNRALGLFRDNKKSLRRAIDYL